MNAKQYFGRCSRELNVGEPVTGMCEHHVMRACWVSELVNPSAEITDEQLRTILCLFFNPHTRREEDADEAVKIATFINTCHT